MEKKKFKIVKVKWKDARTYEGTYGFSEIKDFKLAETITIGYLINEDKERIVLCGYVFPSDEFDFQSGYRYIHLIPRSNIIKIEEL